MVSPAISVDLTPRQPTSGRVRRLLSCIYRQQSNTRWCPDLPALDGNKVLITGGAAGIGEFISRGFLDRGAEVINLSRGKSEGTDSIPGLTTINTNLADPESVINAVRELKNLQFDIVLCNAGVLTNIETRTAAGIERTFAINVLGHHLLYRLLMRNHMLARHARIIITTGDIYAMERECSAGIPFDTAGKVYARSKLGNLWQVAELAQRFPEICPLAVHPGVVASGFGGLSKTGLASWLRQRLLISEEAGAQSSLIAATQNLPRGSYWHNVFGVVNPAADDPFLNTSSSAHLWDQLELLCAPYLKQF